MAEHTKAAKAEKKPKHEPRYRVLAGISTRREPRLDCEDWLEYAPGETHAAHTFPEHMDLAALVASGHLEIVGAPADSEEVSHGEN